MGALVNPAVAGILLGVGLRLIVRLQLPSSLVTALTILALGLLGTKSGLIVAEDRAGVSSVLMVCSLVAIASAVVARAAFGRMARLGPADSGALAVHYASVSVAAYPLLTAYLERVGFAVTGHIASTFVVLEVLGLLAGLTVASLSSASVRQWNMALRQSLVGREIIALTLSFGVSAGIGQLVSDDASNLIGQAFGGLLPIYMVTVGMTLGTRLGDLRLVAGRLVGTTIAVSLMSAVVAATVARLASWSIAETAALLVMAASASYVAAPGIVRRAIPDASPTISLTCAVAITFPLNVIFGIPGFVAIARWMG